MDAHEAISRYRRSIASSTTVDQYFSAYEQLHSDCPEAYHFELVEPLSGLSQLVLHDDLSVRAQS